jgi:hypothetical protein
MKFLGGRVAGERQLKNPGDERLRAVLNAQIMQRSAA